MLRLLPTTSTAANANTNKNSDLSRRRRAAEKKRLERLKIVRTNFQDIVKSEVAYLNEIRKKYEPIITFADTSDDPEVSTDDADADAQ